MRAIDMGWGHGLCTIHKQLGNPDLKKLNIGCGCHPISGFYNVDLVKYPGVDQKIDLSETLPWPDNTWDIIYASHVLEHISNLYSLIEELLRISKPGAYWEVHSPVGWNTMAAVDHCRIVTEGTFGQWFPQNYQGSPWEALGIKPPGFIKVIKKYYSREFKIGPITGYHARKYLGLEIGRKHLEFLIMRVIK